VFLGHSLREGKASSMQGTRQQNASAEMLGRAIEVITMIILLEYHNDFRREKNTECIFVTQ
jgi:hypothetical protein